MVSAKLCDISIVVPVYAGASTLGQLYSNVARVLDATAYTFELILVDDRGSEANWNVILGLASRDARVIGIRLSRNYGQHAATLCGLVHASGRCVVTMDEDLEHPPEAIPALVQACDDEHPLVYGVFPKRTHAWYRNLSSGLMRRVLKKAFPEMNADYTSFRAMRLSLARKLGEFDLNRPYIDGMLSWITNSVATVMVTHGDRVAGESAYTLRKLVSHSVNIFITFSNLPLRLASYFGALIAATSFAFMGYVVFAQLTGVIRSPPGYASILSAVLFACGVQLVILGVLGEYIGRLTGATYRKPVFVVDRDSREQISTSRAGGL